MLKELLKKRLQTRRAGWRTRRFREVGEGLSGRAARPRLQGTVIKAEGTAHAKTLNSL